MRVYSAGGVVFRLISTGAIHHASISDSHIIDQQSAVDHLNGRSEFAGSELKSAIQSFEGYPRDVTIEVALVGRRSSPIYRGSPGIWALPKGTPKAGETIEQVAVREVQEETGLQVRLIAYIGSITYWFVRQQVRYHKQVRHFLLEAIGGDIALHDQEYDMVEWFPLYEACRRLTYQNEVNILYQAEDILQRWLRSREGHT